MPLSEQEQRLLDEMERNLYQNDADFVASVGGRRTKPNARSITIGILIAIIGIAALITGVVVRQPVVGVIGFAIMFAGVLIAVAPPRRLASPAPRSNSPKPTGAKTGAGRKSGSFMDGLNDRWDRRNEDRNS
ncbi:DUF3040 domain-containing protein [soil metagenome]